MTPRILIVDDERQNRQLLEIMLTPEFTTASAVNGEEALAIVAREPPDLVVCDVMMPGLDGYQVSAAIKCAAATRHIPIVLVTGLDDHRAEARARAAGADEFLSRPLDRAVLCERIRTLLRTVH
jgi:PleD family two-component response regulator